jgi:hypothetical protein
MADLFLVLFFVSLIGLITGLANPSIFTRITKKEITRKKIGLGFGVAMLVFAILTGATAKPKDEVAQLQPEKTAETREVIEPETTNQVKKEPDTKTPELTPTPTPAPAPETKTQRDTMIEIFKANALTKWGSDYEMVSYEIEQQTKAYDWIIKNASYDDILTRAKQKWANDYTMVKYEYNQQADSYEWINQQTEYPAIMTRAKQKWGNDYTMVEYEYKKQVNAYESL